MLECLCQLYPIDRLVLVGAGTGSRLKTFENLSAGSVLLIEADQDREERLAAGLVGQARYTIKNELIGRFAGEAHFYLASNRNESGLIEPHRLARIWRNLTATEQRTRPCTTLDALLEAEMANGAAAANWVVVDCLPALDILRGAGRLIEDWDVVSARVVLDDAIVRLDPDLGKQELVQFMAEHNYRVIGVEPERHPGFGQMLFARDWKRSFATRLTKMANERERLATGLATIDQKLAEAQAAHESGVHALEQRIGELGGERDALRVEKDRLTAERDTLRQAIADQSAASQTDHDRLRTEIADLTGQRDAAVESRAVGQATSTRYAFEAEGDKQEHASLRAANARLATERDALKQQLAEHDKTQKQMQAQIADLRSRLDKAVVEPKAPAKTDKVKFSSNANIDDFLEDISPFFLNRHITYVDVGAYVGELFMKLHSNKKFKIRYAHLFEPNKTSFDLLQKNVSEYKDGEYRTYNLALGDSDKEVRLVAEKEMTKVVEGGQVTAEHAEVFTAKCRRIDDMAGLFADRHIDLLKIDVEGYEIPVLKGASDMLHDQRIDMIYIEVGFDKKGTQQTYFAKVDKFLQAIGYRVFKIYEQRNEWMSDLPTLRRCNFAYMSSNFAMRNPFLLSRKIVQLQEEISSLKTDSNGSRG